MSNKVMTIVSAICDIYAFVYPVSFVIIRLDRIYL